MTRREARKALVAAETSIRDHSSELTRAMGGVPNTALLRARNALSVAAIELAAARREWDEQDEAEKTPVRPPSRQDIQAAFSNSVAFANGTRKP